MSVKNEDNFNKDNIKKDSNLKFKTHNKTETKMDPPQCLPTQDFNSILKLVRRDFDGAPEQLNRYLSNCCFTMNWCHHPVDEKMLFYYI